MELIKDVSIVFISIFFESLPFLLLGSFISSIIETYVSNETMARIIPKNKFFGIKLAKETFGDVGTYGFHPYTTDDSNYTLIDTQGLDYSKSLKDDYFKNYLKSG